MLALETRVNGILINCTYVQREELPIKEGIYEYYIEHHRINREPKVIEFRIQHKREEGAEKLSLFIYKEIDKRLKKGKS